MEVHKVLGPGFLEAIYQEALEIELGLRRVAFHAQPTIPLFYKGQELKKFYQPDFICYGEVLVEIKAEKKLTAIDEAQIINALKCGKKKTGLLINFGEPSLVYRRFVH